MPPASHLHASRRVIRWLVVALLALLVPAVGEVAWAAPGSDPFVAGQAYTGDFPDPSLLRVGDTYYAYATTTGGDHLPAMWSTDLSTWYAHDAWPLEDGYSTQAGYNDAMPHLASYAAAFLRRSRWVTSAWAPSVAYVGGRYVAAYVVQTSVLPLRRCISVATSADPMGPFVDASTAPLQCSSDPIGSIDPMIYLGPSEIPYLLWKNTGVPGRKPARLMERRLAPSGTAFQPGSRAYRLLSADQTWEAHVVENPAMIWYAGRRYLFYSGNSWTNERYGTGYAICATVRGPCVRPRARPLLATGGDVSGPGGAFPIVAADGSLRLAYAAWDYGRVGYPTSATCRRTAAGCNQRRMHIATLAVRSNGTLAVTDRG